MSRRSSWAHRLVVVLAVALLWAALHYVVGGALLWRGPDRPIVVLIGDGGLLAGVVVLLLLAGGAFVCARLCDCWGRLAGGAGARPPALQGVIAAGLALALWAWSGGTMDDWLKLRQPIPGPAQAAPYWPLLAEYVYWAAALAAVVAAGCAPWPTRGAAGGQTGRRARDWQRTLGWDTGPAALRDGLIALGLTVVIGAVLISVLTGPRVGHTYRGQVYFAVGAAFLVAVLVARRVSPAAGLIWYLPGPLLVGICGVVLAVWKPTLPAGYEHINVIPAWGLVRPLPIEMISVGTVAVVLALRSSRRLSSDEQAC